MEILSGLSEGEIAEILSRFGTSDFGEGDILFAEGDEGKELYVVESGEIAVSIGLPGGGEKEIARVAPGDFFGEMSIFEDAPRSATCRARAAAKLLSLNRESFFRLIDDRPDIAVKMMSRMLNIATKRLRSTSRFVADTVRWGEEARRRAITDDLTGLYNRRYLDEALKDQFALASRKGHPLSVVMMDLDNFREINERYGADAGDRAIVAVAEQFRRHLRKADIPARYGGDEFIALMPDADLGLAEETAESIKEAVRGISIHEEHGAVLVTVSQGIASFPSTESTLKGLLAGADRALYAAKERGRDRIVRDEGGGAG